MRPGDPNAWELTAPENTATPMKRTTVMYGWRPRETAHRPTRSQLATVAVGLVLGFVAGALAGGWRP